MCDDCQRSWNILAMNKLSQRGIQISDVFDVYGIDVIGPLPSSRGIQICI